METRRSILLLGLPDTLASDLLQVLSRESWAVDSQPYLSDHLAADLIFCAAEPQRYRALLEELKRKKPGLPVVVVSRLPDISNWLDAIEAGASDYCAPPFDAHHIQWIVQSALRSQPIAA